MKGGAPCSWQRAVVFAAVEMVAPAGCRARESAPNGIASAAAAPATSTVDRPASAAASPACRVMKLEGAPVRVRSQGNLLALGDWVPPSPIEVDDGGELVVKSTVSGRELAVRGAAVAELCPRGDEEVRLSLGTFRGFPGAGVRPGAEVWVATPFGVVRFNDANLEVSVSPPRAASLSVKLVSGQAVFAPLARTSAGGALAVGRDVALAAGKTFSVEGPRPSAKELVAGCAELGGLVEEKARSVLSADGGSLGHRAGLYVEARRNARAVCSSAAAAVGLVDDGHEGLSQQIESAEKRWKSVPMTAQASEAPARSPRSN